MKTTFSAGRMDFTKRAHLAAQTQFYPQLFPGASVTFEDTVGTTRDLEYAIDCQLAVDVPGLRGPLRTTVQERWRKPQYMRFGDITVTEWNTASGLPSELHKLHAHTFVYGFYDEQWDRVVAGVAVNVLQVIRSLALGTLPYRRGSRLDQTFLAFAVPDLRRIGAVMGDVDNRPRPDDDWPPVAIPGAAA